MCPQRADIYARKFCPLTYNGIARINIYAVIVLVVTDQCLFSFCNKLCWGLVVSLGEVSASSVSAVGGTRVESSDSEMHMY